MWVFQVRCWSTWQPRYFIVGTCLKRSSFSIKWRNFSPVPWSEIIRMQQDSETFSFSLLIISINHIDGRYAPSTMYGCRSLLLVIIIIIRQNSPTPPPSNVCAIQYGVNHVTLNYSGRRAEGVCDRWLRSFYWLTYWLFCTAPVWLILLLSCSSGVASLFVAIDGAQSLKWIKVDIESSKAVGEGEGEGEYSGKDSHNDLAIYQHIRWIYYLQ